MRVRLDRRQVEAPVHALQRLTQILRVRYIARVMVNVRWEPVAVGQIVQHTDIVTSGIERTAQMGADEARPAGDQP